MLRLKNYPTYMPAEHDFSQSLSASNIVSPQIMKQMDKPQQQIFGGISGQMRQSAAIMPLQGPREGCEDIVCNEKCTHLIKEGQAAYYGDCKKKCMRENKAAIIDCCKAECKQYAPPTAVRNGGKYANECMQACETSMFD